MFKVATDIMVSVFIIATSINYVGFVVSLLMKHLKYMKSKTFPLQIPIMHKFRKPKTVFSSFGIITIIFIIMACTSAGFPFVKEVAPQRYYVLVSLTP